MISIFDTSIACYNIGNQIIMDAVNKELVDLFPNEFFIHMPVEEMGFKTRMYNRNSNYSFVGGTNLLNSNIRKYRQWGLTLHNILILRNCILMGCGWWQYEDIDVSRYTKWAFNKVLSHRMKHSVRDNYTKERLQCIGIDAINTGCPTLWRLTPEHTKTIVGEKRHEVVITLTDYNKNPERDKVILDTCVKSYENVYYFVQGSGDLNYINELGFGNKLTIIPPRLECYNELLENNDIDYIGTRLHGGIRALQKGRRAFIVGIDNRALEMKKDFNLPVIEQENIQGLSEMITQDYNLQLNIPFDNIEEWKNQFK